MARHNEWRFKRDPVKGTWKPTGLDTPPLTLWWEAKWGDEPVAIFKQPGRSEWVGRGQPGEWFPTEFLVVRVIAREAGLIHGEIMLAFPTSDAGRTARWAGDGLPKDER